jgi:hypothetical protein
MAFQEVSNTAIHCWWRVFSTDFWECSCQHLHACLAKASAMKEIYSELKIVEALV